jgi:hypothetical protein
VPALEPTFYRPFGRTSRQGGREATSAKSEPALPVRTMRSVSGPHAETARQFPDIEEI